MVSIPKIPTSGDVGTLPWTLGVLQGQVDKINHAAPNSATTKQKLVAYLTGSVFVAVSAFFDGALHLAAFVVKAPGVALKQLAKITSLSKYVSSPALDASDWVGHVKKARAVAFLFFVAWAYGLANDQEQVLNQARNLEVISTGSSGKKRPAAV